MVTFSVFSSETQYFNIKDGSGNLLSQMSGKGNSFDLNMSDGNLSISTYNTPSDGGFGGDGEGGFSLGLAKNEMVSNTIEGAGLGSEVFSEILNYGSKFDKKTTGTVDFAREVAAGKYFSKGAKFLGKASNVVSGVSIGYDFATGTANTSTFVDGAVLIGSITAGAVFGIAAAPYIAAFGIAYGTAVVFGFDDYINEQFDISKSVNFVTP